MSGALLALGAAAMLGLNTAVVRRSMLRASAYNGIVITILLSVPLFVLLALVTGQLTRIDGFTGIQYGALAVGGILNFLGGRFSQFLAVQAMGANLTSPVRVLSGLVGAVFGITLLGEQVGLLRGAGIALLIVAPLVAFARPPTVRLGSLQIARGILFGLTAAATYGGSTVLLRWALEDSGLTMLGGLVAFGAAALLLVPSLALPGRLQGLLEVDRTAVKLFVAVTVMMALAQVLRFAALESADAAVVAPLTETMAFFGVGFAFLLNRDTEAFNPLVLLGIVLAAAGAVAITL
ncbi:MAG: DMT family transporter [Chloroflexota bacterium]|nr:DMT family transporter [Chloroflexota bacterium]MDE2884413.1 DMT family transporter [Chloroflexota bacterium]